MITIYEDWENKEMQAVAENTAFLAVPFFQSGGRYVPLRELGRRLAGYAANLDQMNYVHVTGAGRELCYERVPDIFRSEILAGYNERKHAQGRMFT